MSIWIYKHDTGRGIEKSPYSIWFPLHYAGNRLVIKKQQTNKQGDRLRKKLNASVYNSLKGKASRAGVCDQNIMRRVHPICHP